MCQISNILFKITIGFVFYLGYVQKSVDASTGQVDTFLSLVNYIQKESTSVSSAQQSIKSFLNSKDISIGVYSNSKQSELLGVNKTKIKKLRFRITQSTKKNHIDCRVSLERAQLGSKCIAPCGCSGSQKWIQFNLLNRLRRKDPDQWKLCRTCQKPFDYGFISKYGGIEGNLISLVLDNLVMLRSGIVALALLSAGIINLPKLITRILVSKHFWQQYPRWSRIIHLPFVFLLWGFKILAGNILEIYLSQEKRILMMLTDMETKIVEPKLPVTESGEEINQ